jgi:hypothetical protein
VTLLVLREGLASWMPRSVRQTYSGVICFDRRRIVGSAALDRASHAHRRCPLLVGTARA